MRITVLAGGVGGARFLAGVRRFAGSEAGGELPIAIVNTGDDMWHAGLRITPDIDSILYALAGVNDTERGWGRHGETERVSAELSAWGVGWPWFTLGDLDLGTHIARSSWLREGVPLHEVVERLSQRWPLGVRMIPATDDEVETHVVVRDRDGERHMHFQEWWTRYRATEPALRFEQLGVEQSRPAPGVLDAIRDADVVLLAPSNPVVSIGTILGIPGVRNALRDTATPVVGLSPIIGGVVVRGMADACLTAIGVETSAEAVGLHYGARSANGVIDAWLVDSVDADSVPRLEAAGIRAAARPLWMTDPDETDAMVSAALDLVR